jgi:hypothetical protein
MILIFQYSIEPIWASKAPRFTIGKVLPLLANKQSDWLNVFLHKKMAYLILSNGLDRQFIRMTENEWDIVNHIMHCTPSGCVCNVCEWRKLRGKYLKPMDEFAHLFPTKYEFRKLD